MIVPNYDVDDETDKEARDGVAVVCDRCKIQWSRLRFNNESEVRDWMDGKDYMNFELPACADVFHRIGSRLYCEHCTEKLIQETHRDKGKSLYAGQEAI